MTPLNILIVEDDIMIGMLLSDLLTALDHTVCAVERTELGAIAAAARFQPDLMIVDIHLKLGSGISVVEAVHRDRIIPHIFVTGDRHGMQSLTPGEIIVEKPYRERDLLEAIKRATAIQKNAQ